MNKSSGNKVDVNDAVSHLRKVDPVLCKIISDEFVYGVYRKRSVFESLVRIIIGQQLSA